MKTALTLLFAFALINVNAASINFLKFTSLEQALAKGKSENKPIFFDTYADWCGWCKYMEKNIFSVEDVANYFNENFVCYQLNADNSNSDEFTYKYDVSGLPCLLILDDQGEVLSRNDGAFTDTEEFIDFGKMAYYKLYPETSPWFQNQKKFEAGERSPEFLKEYAFSMIDGDYSEEEMDEVVEIYWQEQEDHSLLIENNFDMFYVFNNDMDSPLMKTFLKDKEELIEEWDEETYFDKVVYVIEYNLGTAIYDDNEELYNKVYLFAEKHLKNQDIYEYKETLDSIEEIWRER